MKQPKEPNKEECCGSGCNPCIFDVYEEQLRLFQSSRYERNSNSSNEQQLLQLPHENAMSQLEYTPFHIIKNIDICQQHRLLLFKQDKIVTNKRVFWNPGDHFLVKYSCVNNSCTRAYTPIKIEHQEDYDFAIIVKRIYDGLVSNYLCDLNIREFALWRGPYGQYKLESDQFNRIIMIAQGTGIAPLFSIIQNVLSDEDKLTRMILMYCCKCVETILLRDELYKLKSYWNFEYVIYLSKKAEKDLMKYKEPISINKLTLKDILHLKPFTKTDQFLLCGSDAFMKQYNELLQQEKVDKNNIVTF